MENNKIIKRIQYAVKIKLASPLCIASGFSEITDKDVQRNAQGEVFIPGSSLAGAMRQYLEEHTNYNKNVALLFGHNRDSDGSMSRIQISDMYFSNATTVIVRDGVALKDKVAIDGAKYDIQAIETGAWGMCWFLLTIRQSDEESIFTQMIQTWIMGLMQDEIRLGSNKNRGFGKLEVVYRTFSNDTQKIAEVYKKEFTKQNLFEWLEFTKQDFMQALQDEQMAKSVLWEIDGRQIEENYITIRVPLKQKGGISIRTYSVVPGQPDYEYLKYKNNAVISGTSWAGAIRARSLKLLQSFIKDKELAQSYINLWFGFIDENTSCQSNVIFSESFIQNGIPLQMTRNSINRFTGASLEGGLYTEKSYFNGTLVLEMKVRKNYYKRRINNFAQIGNEATCVHEKVMQTDNAYPFYTTANEMVYFKKDDSSHYENLIGLLLVVAKDIQNGYLAVGGQTAIGRGLFEKNEEIQILGTDKDETYFIQTLGKLVHSI